MANAHEICVIDPETGGQYQVAHEKSPVFYDTYERKADLRHQTHYCPGCGHGVVNKLIAEAIDELGIKDKTIFVSPVGCSVFCYYYFDVGNIQAAHGRASAVAVAAKRACPDKVVLAYQGDGDLAAIGTAEIIHAANRGEKIAVFFVNNGIYGMTGGQMAPTTLVGQKTMTTPWGRHPAGEGFPLHMSELLSTLEAPTYIERVALCDNKNIMRARRAVRHALELQRDNAGFSFVEILSPCPTIWGKDPVDARAWVADGMVPVFPLALFRDRKAEMPDVPEPPRRSVAEVLELTTGPEKTSDSKKSLAPRHHSFNHLGIKIAGFGGQGVLLLGQLLTEMGMREHLEVSWLPSYGPEMRSGSAHCHVCLSKERVGSPLISAPDVLVAMNEISLHKFAHTVVRGGLILYNGSGLPEGVDDSEVHILCIPAGEIADVLGSPKAANIVMLGALLESTECLSSETAMQVLEAKVKKVQLLEIDRKALAAGRDYIDHQVNVGAVNQPDGFA